MQSPVRMQSRKLLIVRSATYRGSEEAPRGEEESRGLGSLVTWGGGRGAPVLEFHLNSQLANMR